MKLLFVAWAGPAQNYMESLFLPILAAARDRWRERTGGRIDLHVLEFTWGPLDRRESTAAAAERSGVRYESRTVWRARPLAVSTAAMVARGAVAIATTCRRHGIDIVMPRSIIPSAMTMLARWLDPRGRMLVDADGLMADERVDFGGWNPQGRTYRAFRAVEAHSIRAAHAVVTRTERARQILLERAGETVPAERIVVVSNGKDESQFHPGTDASRRATREQQGVALDAPWLIYTGSIGQQYYPEAMLQLLVRVRERRPDARLTVLTGQADETTRLIDAGSLPRETVDAINVRRVPAAEVPALLAAADVGIAFRQPAFSQRAVAPIKVGEYLLCGLPVIATSGVGDLDAQLAGDAGSRVLPDVSATALERAADWIVTDAVANREHHRIAARLIGERHYSLSDCADRYCQALEICLAAPRH